MALVICCAGCASYEAVPLRPAATEAELRARSLSDPRLQTYMARWVPDVAPVTSWTLDRLTLAALYFHPDLAVARARAGIAEAGVITAGMRPNPTVTVSPGLSANSPKDTLPWIMGVTFDLTIETAGKRDRRIELAERGVDAASLEIAERAWEIRSRLRSALVARLLSARELESLRAEAAIRAEAVSLMGKKYAAGEVSRPDVDSAEIELHAARLAVRVVEGRANESLAALAQAIGAPVTALAGVGLEWPDFDRPPGEGSLALPRVQEAGLVNRVDVRRALAEYAVSEAALALEVANQYPDLHIGPGYFWDQGQHKFALGVSMTIPILNQHEGPIAEAEARRREAAARFLALQARVIGETEQALARYRAAVAELADAGALLGQMDDRERLARRAVELGDEDPLTLAGVRVQRAVAARSRLDALGRVQAALGALEDAVQRPLAPPMPVPGVSFPFEGSEER